VARRGEGGREGGRVGGVRKGNKINIEKYG
jgi:hypothetical protein